MLYSIIIMLVVFSLDTWGVIGIIVISFYVVIPYLLFAVPVQVLFNKHPKKFSVIYFCLYIFFSLPAVFIYSSVLNFDIKHGYFDYKELLCNQPFSGTVFLVLGLVFLQKKSSAS
ncbi:UPF0715 family protein [Peribacillus frigoritolerans]|uniref:UPF0715 family protein n=1 Tax=Peribacillus frigoritolerans TaxID=450367 RepID=UPI003AB596C9